MGGRPVVIVSNRGPVSFRRDDTGALVARRGAGGLVSGIAPLVRDTDSLWIAAAFSAGDREMSEDGVVDAEGFRIHLLDVDDKTWDLHYNAVCNEALWFAHHGLWDPVYAPSWPRGWVDADDGPWQAHREVNRRFALAVIDHAPADAAVLVQDYHLCLLAPLLREARPDLRLVHFAHTPFATPEWLHMLPAGPRHELLEGLAAHHACGFHTARWAEDFEACCEVAGVTPPQRFVAPLGPDAGDIGGVAGSAACDAALDELEGAVGDRSLIVRVDRIELSKNLLRGFDAYEALLEDVRWHDRVVFAALVYPSRVGVPAYDQYRSAVARRVDDINDRFGTDAWQPILYDDTDDFPRSIAALRRYDVLLVNPIRDGLNLVAKEGAMVNERDGLLVLSPEAGAWAELASAAIPCQPFDISDTAAAMASALEMDGDARAERSRRLRAAATSRTPASWFDDQIRAAD